MCIQTKTIKNPSKYFNPLIDKKFLDVPCGSCWQCKQQKRDGIFVRSYFEWKKAQSLGGTAVFMTLTYDNDSLPTVADGVPCFRTADIQKFLKAFRQHLTRLCVKYHYKDLVKDSLKYIYSMEYGEKRHRPHYHFVFYLHSNFPPLFFIQECKRVWQKTNGFAFSSNHNYGVLNSTKALKYVTKYVTKDFFDDAYLRTVIDHLKTYFQVDDKFIHNHKSSPRVIAYLDAVKAVKPSWHCSTGFGLFGIEKVLKGLNTQHLIDVCPSDVLTGRVSIPDEKEEFKTYKLPLYFERAMLFRQERESITINEHDKTYKYFSTHYVLNNAGRYVRKFRHDDYYNTFKEIINTSIHNDHLNSPEFIEFLNQHATPELLYNNYADFLLDLNHYTKNLSQDFIDWCFYVRGYETNLHELEISPYQVNDLSLYEIYNNRLDFDRFRNQLSDFSPNGITYLDELQSSILYINQIYNQNDFTTFANGYNLLQVLFAYCNRIKEKEIYENNKVYHQLKYLHDV